MMITITLAPIQSVQSTNSNPVTCAKLAYEEAKMDYQILEQQIRSTPTEHFNLLVQLNEELAVAAQKMELAFDDWSKAIDSFVGISIKPDPVPAAGLRLIDGWLYDSHDGRTLA